MSLIRACIGIYPHFGQGLSFCFRRSFPLVMLCVAICSIAQCASPSTHYTFDDLWYLPSSKLSWQDIMTGNTDGFFWWIPLAGLAMSIGVVSLLWLLVDGTLRIAAHASAFFTKQCGLTSWPSRRHETRQQQFQRRAVTTLILFLLVATFIPYQFVFVVAFLVQIVTCVRALVRSKALVSLTRHVKRIHFANALFRSQIAQITRDPTATISCFPCCYSSLHCCRSICPFCWCGSEISRCIGLCPSRPITVSWQLRPL